jgi:hypothetical protein
MLLRSNFTVSQLAKLPESNQRPLQFHLLLPVTQHEKGKDLQFQMYAFRKGNNDQH